MTNSPLHRLSTEAPELTLAEFFTARLDELAVMAPAEHYGPREAPEREWEWCPRARSGPLGDLPGGPDAECECDNPARRAYYLADIAAKRRTLAAWEQWATTDRTDYGDALFYGLSLAIKALASAFATHPDYRQEWAP